MYLHFFLKIKNNSYIYDTKLIADVSCYGNYGLHTSNKNPPKKTLKCRKYFCGDYSDSWSFHRCSINPLISV